MSKTALLFPGQGSQSVGMGQALVERYDAAREVFETVDKALGKELTNITFNGPEEELTLTENTQPALMAVSLAVIKVLEHEYGKSVTDLADGLAGHSLGEYSAYAAGQAFSVEQTAKLLQVRGQAMQDAVPVGQGAMAAILGLEIDAVSDICQSVSEEGNVSALANDNCPGQIVVSGHKGAVALAAEKAQEAGAKRAVILPVSAPFHSPLMAPAAKAMEAALGKAEIKMPVLPVYTNVTTQPVEDVEQIRSTLVEQVTGQVRWRETINHMIDDGYTRFIEIGAGKVLSGLMRRISRDVEMIQIGTPDDIESFLNN